MNTQSALLTDAPETIPKIIWILWMQGVENAPPLVKACIDSWRIQNPDWQLRVIDQSNLDTYVDIEQFRQPHLKIQAMSDILRINLLAKYGGVWVDATCYCQTPLDTWLNDCLTSGFFAFRRSDPLRYMSTWFLASVQGNYLTLQLSERVNSYWRQNPNLQRHPLVEKFVRRIANQPKHTNLWFSYLMRRIFKVYPYMWFAYLFSDVIQSQPRAQRIWEQTPRMDAGPPHKLQRVGLLNPLTSDIKHEIDARLTPVYKLNWRGTQDYTASNSVLEYLLSPSRVRKNSKYNPNLPS